MRAGVLLTLLAGAGASVAAEPDRGALGSSAAQIFGPLPKEATAPDRSLDEAQITLGRMLYYDPRLSKNHDISCNTCHLLDQYGVDGEPTSKGHRGQRGPRSAPSVYNAAFHVSQFWDGRAKDVEEQAKGPILNPIEMAMPDEASVVAVVKSIPGYPPLFAAAFPKEKNPVTYDNLAIAIGAFERRLVTPGRLDRFMEGDKNALTQEEVLGLKAFINVGCITCHNGPTLGGLTYQKLGLLEPYETSDAGRFDVTGNETDRQVFKVPSLRNIAKTGPYLHDGSIGNLNEIVILMGRHQLGRKLTPAEVASIVAFLGALTGDIDAAYTAKPVLPASGPDTPGPDPS